MLTRYEPWNALRQIHDEMNRVFGQMPARSDDGSEVFATGWVPAVVVKEEDQRFLITADVPGVEPDQIEVTMENGMLTIKGERKAETTDEREGGYRRVERSHGVFYRRFTLPDTADAEKVTATGKNGVLEVVIPKKEAVQPKRISVSS